MLVLKQLWKLVLLLLDFWSLLRVVDRSPSPKGVTLKRDFNHAYRSKWPHSAKKTEAGHKINGADQSVDADSLHNTDGYRRD
ncbi:hypothetical protein [Cohaesibacter intestini]|uniref:hypothetical protein n=1 Tax=Cohaesibacter intestini TaxID=2211145 RepID=UPI00130025E6|nr:hypothetical protein [Cohaesibacter intestini]